MIATLTYKNVLDAKDKIVCIGHWLMRHAQIVGQYTNNQIRIKSFHPAKESRAISHYANTTTWSCITGTRDINAPRRKFEYFEAYAVRRFFIHHHQSARYHRSRVYAWLLAGVHTGGYDGSSARTAFALFPAQLALAPPVQQRPRRSGRSQERQWQGLIKRDYCWPGRGLPQRNKRKESCSPSLCVPFSGGSRQIISTANRDMLNISARRYVPVDYVPKVALASRGRLKSVAGIGPRVRALGEICLAFVDERRFASPTARLLSARMVSFSIIGDGFATTRYRLRAAGDWRINRHI